MMHMRAAFLSFFLLFVLFFAVSAPVLAAYVPPMVETKASCKKPCKNPDGTQCPERISCTIWGVGTDKPRPQPATVCDSLIEGKLADKTTAFLMPRDPKNPKAEDRCSRREANNRAGPSVVTKYSTSTPNDPSCVNTIVDDRDRGEEGGEVTNGKTPPRQFGCTSHHKIKTAEDAYQYMNTCAGEIIAASGANPKDGYPSHAHANSKNMCIQYTMQPPSTNANGEGPHKPNDKDVHHAQAEQPGSYAALAALFTTSQDAFDNTYGGGVKSNGAPGKFYQDGSTKGGPGPTYNMTLAENPNGIPMLDRKNPMAFLTAAYLYTPAYAKYNPNSYRPGEEIKLAKALEGKTIDEVKSAKAFGSLLARESVAAAPSDIPKGIFEQLNPKTFQNHYNEKQSCYTCGTEPKKSRYGLQLINPSPGLNGIAGMLDPSTAGGGSFEDMVKKMVTKGLGGGAMPQIPTNFNQIIQQIMQAAGGQGGGGGGGQGGGGAAAANCSAALFGNVDQCVGGLSQIPPNPAYCAPMIATCMGTEGGYTTRNMDTCMARIAEENCAETAAADKGDGGARNALNNLKSLFTNMGNMGNFGGLGGAGPKTMPEFKQPAQGQKAVATSGMNNNTSIWAPIPQEMGGIERPHYSPCTANKNCNVGRDHTPYDFWEPWCKSATDCVRAAGSLSKYLPVNLLDQRWTQYNAHMLERITYNRWCWADEIDPLRCTPGHVCAPKPCPCRLSTRSPCFKCWKATPAEPPAAVAWDAKTDKAYWKKLPYVCPGSAEPEYGHGRSYAYCPKVAGTLQQKFVIARSGKWQLPDKEMDIWQVSHNLAKPIDLSNKVPLRDAKEQAKQKLNTGQTYFYGSSFGCARPFIRTDTTGKAKGDTSAKPDYNGCEGGMLAVATTKWNIYGDQNPANKPAGTATALMSKPTVNFASDGKSVSLIEDAVAQAAGGAPNSDQPCLGGPGNSTAGTLGPSKGDQWTGPMELKWSIAMTDYRTGTPCFPDTNHTQMPLSQTAMASYAVAGNWEKMLKKIEITGPGSGNTEGGGDDSGPSRSMKWPLHYLGWPGHPNKQGEFPLPDSKAETGTGLSDLVKKGIKARGCHIYSKKGFAVKDPPGLACAGVAVVEEVGEDADGEFIKVLKTNNGPYFDNACQAADAGQITRVRMQKDTVPDEALTELREAKYPDGTEIREDCVTGSPAGICKTDWNATWYCYNDEENLNTGK